MIVQAARPFVPIPSPPNRTVAADLHTTLDELTAGAARWAACSPRARAELARRVAIAAATVADAWAETALAVKQAAVVSGPALAEELATGPVGTARLALVHARALLDIAERGLPRPAAPPRVRGLEPAGGRAAGTTLVAVDVFPATGPRGTLHDRTVYRGVTATVRCHDPGGLVAFERAWRREAEERPRAGGVALVLGAGNVSGLGLADVLCQVFEHGRAALLKLHPIQAPLETVLEAALAPLVEAGVVAIMTGGAEEARAALDAPQITHVHVTGGQATFEAIVWGGPRPADPQARPRLGKPITCELGNVTPWIVLPGRYSRSELAFQADEVAASIANNTSFNCIATKVVVTCRSWDQRERFLGLVRRRLESLPARPGWYPGSTRAWEEATGRTAPADGTLPWSFTCGVDPAADDRLVRREWFAPVAVEVPFDGDTLADFCGRAGAFANALPGSLAAAITMPPHLSSTDKGQAERLVDRLTYGVVAVNGWPAIAYAVATVPWGGFPGGTPASPRSGIGFVHDPLLLPEVHNSVVRRPLWSPLRPPWFPWHSSGVQLTRGTAELYGRCAVGRSGAWTLTRMLPAVLRG